jgi:hypothetical protein
VAGLLLGRRFDARGPIAAAAVVLFAVPVAVHGLRHWSPAAEEDSHALTAGLLEHLRDDVPERAVVFSDLETSYRIEAFAPVYVAAAPPAHVADTKANRPYSRRLSVIRYFASGDSAILDRYHADWLVVDRARFHVRPQWPLVYDDARYALYHRRT